MSDLKKSWIKVEKKPPKTEPYFHSNYIFHDDYAYDITDILDFHHCIGCRCHKPSERNKRPSKKKNKKV